MTPNKRPWGSSDVLTNVYDEDKNRLRVDAELEVGDIEIGAVELKDGGSDNRAKVNADGSLNVNASLSTSVVGVKNVLGTQINPATEDTLATRLADSTFTTRINTLGQKAMAGSTPVVLPSDQIVPVYNLWQKDTYDGKGFSFITPDITVSVASEVNFALFKNPNASGKLVRLRNFIFGITKGTANIYGIFRIYRNPTITTDGTAITINKIRTTQSASSVCSAFYSPTISNRGILTNKFVLSSSNSLIREQDLGRYLEQNENLLITIEPQNSGIIASAFSEFVEE